MDEMVILCAIMVVGPFFFFIVMVCSLKIFGYLNIDLFKPETSSSWSEVEGSSRHRPSRFDGEVIDDADLNEQYAFRDRWTTGLSIAANLPIHIAMTEIPLPTSIRDPTSQISSQVPHSHTSYPRPQVRDHSSERCAAAIPVNHSEISIPMYHEVTSEDMSSEPPPPDYTHATLLLEVQAEQHQIPPPTYNECMQMKMQKICFSKI